MKKKKYKMVSINYTNECVKNPRCKFCYLQKGKEWRTLKGFREQDFFLLGGFEKYISDTEQVSIAYNGVKREILRHFLSMFDNVTGLIVNITTNPKFITGRIFIEMLKIYKKRLGMIALSLDSEKCSVTEWIVAAKKLRKNKIKVGANILMLDEMYPQLGNILSSINKYCGQIHLLRPKFYDQKIPMKERRAIIWLYKQQYKNLFIDQCFRNEFQGIPCTRGKDFVSINADGTVTGCSFNVYRSIKENRPVKKCPYI